MELNEALDDFRRKLQDARGGGEDLAVSQNLRYLFGVGYHPTIVFLKGFLGVHRGFDPQPFVLEAFGESLLMVPGTFPGCVLVILGFSGCFWMMLGRFVDGFGVGCKFGACLQDTFVGFSCLFASCYGV